MFASLVSDAFMGLGCLTFSLAMMGGAAFLVALRVGLLSALEEKLKQLGASFSSKDEQGRRP